MRPGRGRQHAQRRGEVPGAVVELVGAVGTGEAGPGGLVGHGDARGEVRVRGQHVAQHPLAALREVQRAGPEQPGRAQRRHPEGQLEVPAVAEVERPQRRRHPSLADPAVERDDDPVGDLGGERDRQHVLAVEGVHGQDPVVVGGVEQVREAAGPEPQVVGPDRDRVDGDGAPRSPAREVVGTPAGHRPRRGVEGPSAHGGEHLARVLGEVPGRRVEGVADGRVEVPRHRVEVRGVGGEEPQDRGRRRHRDAVEQHRAVDGPRGLQDPSRPRRPAELPAVGERHTHPTGVQRRGHETLGDRRVEQVAHHEALAHRDRATRLARARSSQASS